MVTFAVTGSAGVVGRRVVDQLRQDDRTGVVTLAGAGVSRADLKAVLHDADGVVHAGFAGEHGRPGIDGLTRLLGAVAACGVRRVVHVGSATVYGAWPDNPLPLAESTALRPNPGFGFAVVHAEAERVLAEWRTEHPSVAVAVLRPVRVVGDREETWLSTALRRSWVRPRRVAPPVQFVHAADVATAAVVALSDGLDGTFNVAPEGWISGETALALGGTMTGVPVPDALARWLRVDRPYAFHAWVVASDRLRAAGWKPAHSNEEALVAARPRT